MTNTDLSKFRLEPSNFSVGIELIRTDVDDFYFTVVIFNFEDRVAFKLPNKLSFNKAKKTAEKVFIKGVVNLMLWDTSEFCEYNQQSDIDNGHLENIFTYEDEINDGPMEDEDGEIAYRQQIEKEFDEWAKEEEEEACFY